VTAWGADCAANRMQMRTLVACLPPEFPTQN
jgi:hypothetical protein